MTIKKINEMTECKVDTELLSIEVLDAYIKDFEVVYLQWINWLVWYPWIIAENDLKNEEDRKNVEELAKEKEKMEKNLKKIEEKIKYFKNLKYIWKYNDDEVNQL